MGDRRPFSFRFLQSGSPPNSRSPAARTTRPRLKTRISAATTSSAAMPPPPTQTSGQSNTTTPPTAVTENSATKSTATTITSTSTTPPADVMETLATTPTTTTPPNPAPAPAPAPTPPAPTPITQPETKTQMAEQPPANGPTMTTPSPSDLQIADQPTTTNGHQKKSPSRVTTQSPSSSPSRSTTQSRSPPQPSSPSRAAPQARSTPSSPSRMGSQSPSTPQRTSQLRSSSRSPKQTSSRSTNATQSTLPSKESTQDISNSDKPPTFASNENELKPETSQQKHLESLLLADGQTVSEKKIRENQMEVTSPKLSEIGATTSPVKDPQTSALAQTFVSSTVNAEHNPHNESNKKPEETKEVMQATNNEANTTRKKDENHLLTPKSGSEAQTTDTAEIPSKPDQIQIEKKQALDTKEISPASLPDIKPFNATISKPRNSSMSSNARAQSALPSGRHVPLSKDIRDDISKLINQTNTGDSKSKHDRHLSVITLAGENRGASMQMGSNVSKTEGPIHIHRGYKIKCDESAEVTIDGAESSKGNKSEDAESPGDQQRVSYMNNNIQGINNSIVFNSSVAEQDSGVHMVITRVPNEPTETTDRRRPSETRKAEVSITPANKLTYEPNVRRRCIRDLHLEPSDSDPENPQMP